MRKIVHSLTLDNKASPKEAGEYCKLKTVTNRVIFPSLLFIHFVVLRDISTAPCQIEFSIEWDLVLSLSISSRSFPYGHPVAAYAFFLVFPSLLPCIIPSVTCCRRQFLRITWPIQLASHLFIHSFLGLSYNKPTASPKTRSPHSAIYSFLLKFTLSSLFLKVIQ